MNPTQFQFLLTMLPGALAEIRAARLNSPHLMPDNEDLVATLVQVVQQFSREASSRGQRLNPIGIWVAIGLVLYGPHQVPLAWGRFRNALAYVQRWRHRCDGNTCEPFQGASLLQLVFAYALGLRRRVGGVRGESPAQGAEWGAQRWPRAESTLQRFLGSLAIARIQGLANLGFTGIELCGVRIGGQEQAISRQLATHTLGVMLGETPYEEFSAKFFRAANPCSPGGQAETRFRHQQLLSSGWLEQRGWPHERDYTREPYPISEFIARGVGDVPCRARGFEVGLWFPLFSVDCAALEVLRVLVCSQCREPLARFEQCDNCHTPNPHNRLMYWLAPENGPRFRAACGYECRRCRRFQPENHGPCPCGSPGLGFSHVIPGGTRQKRCLNPLCGQLVPRTAHSCTNLRHCRNADYSSRPTQVAFRLPADQQFNPDLYVPGAPAVEHLSDELRAATVDALNSLPREQREVIEATQWEGVTLPQYARRVGCSLEVAEATLTAGFERLREQLASLSAGEFPEPGDAVAESPNLSAKDQLLSPSDTGHQNAKEIERSDS